MYKHQDLHLQPYTLKAECVEGFGFSRTESEHAVSFRQVQYPDGRTVMQGAYQWTEGFSSGWTWRDLPIIQVNEHGEPI